MWKSSLYIKRQQSNSSQFLIQWSTAPEQKKRSQNYFKSYFYMKSWIVHFHILQKNTRRISHVTMYILSLKHAESSKISILPSRPTIAGNLFLLQRKLVVISDFFSSCYVSFCINKNLLLTLNTYNFGVAVGLKRIKHFILSWPENLTNNFGVGVGLKE